jgi:hypothetical protein
MTLLAPSPISRSADHRYTFDGATYPGVTSILTDNDKSDALMSWAARNTAEAAISQIGTLQHLLDNVGAEGVVRALTARSAWKRDEAAQLGTDVHDLADKYVRGVDVDVIALSPYSKHVTHYAEWWQSSGWTLRTSESMVVHPVAGYGGTLDLLCRDRDGRTVLADIKTGKGVYREAVLQLTAYGLAPLIQMDHTVYAMPKVDRYVILHVTAAGVREIEVPVGTLEEVAWFACIELAAWAETTKGKRL